MSVLHHEALLETIFEEVLEEYPQFDEEQCESIARARFEDLCLLLLQTSKNEEMHRLLVGSLLQ